MNIERANGSVVAILVDGEPISRDTVSNFLGHQGVRVAAAIESIGSGMNLIRGLRPNLLIIELPDHPEETLEAIRRIRGEYPNMGIIATSQASTPDLILRAIRSGAQEFLTRPLDLRELTEAINRLVSMTQKGRSVQNRDGKLVLVSAGKGGVGVTCIAANLALALGQQDNARTVLVDLSFRRNDVATLLDLTPTAMLADLIGAGPLDQEALGTVLTNHRSGLSLLFVAETPEQSSLVGAMHLVEAVSLLRQMFDFVVVDASRLEDDRAISVADIADLALLVTVLDVPAVRNLARTLDLLHSTDLPPEKAVVLVNRFHKKSRVTLADLAESTGREPFAQISNDYQAMSLAIDSGSPVVIGAPKSKLARSFFDLAEQVSAFEAAPAEASEGRAS